MIRDLKLLRHFAVLAETLHFGRAAAQLHTTQPPLSRQISALEAELGFPLFERNARRVALTPAGQSFRVDVKALLHGVEQAVSNARKVAAGEAGQLAIGFTMAAVYSVVPRYARQFSAAYPEVALSLRELVSGNLASEVMEGRIDAAVMFPVPARQGLMQSVVFRDRLCLALPRSHPLATRRKVELQALAGEPLVAALRSASPVLRDAIEGQCRDAGFEPDIRMEVELQQTVLGLVAEGVGAALVPDAMRRLRLQDVVFKSIADARQVELVLAWAQASINPCLDRFLQKAGVAA